MHWPVAKKHLQEVLFWPAARYNLSSLITATAELKYIWFFVSLHLVDNLMVSGLCLSRSQGSLTTPRPPEPHPQNKGLFYQKL